MRKSEPSVRNGWIYFRQQFSTLLKNTSRTVKSICLFVMLGYLLSYWNEAVLLLGVTPGYILPPSFKIWTAFTFWFLEIHFWEVFIDVLVVGLCGKTMEPVWGGAEMLTFFVVVNTSVAITSSLFYLFLYICSSDPDLLFNTHLYGLAGYVAAVTVAAKQIIPDVQIFNTRFGKFYNKHIPFTVIVLSMLLWISGLFAGSYPTMVTFGVFVSWIYLRFYQRHSNGTKGCMSDAFSFASFFPGILQPPVSVVSDIIFNILVRLKVCKRQIRPPGMFHANTDTSPESREMNRRREIALKALTDRLSKSETPVVEPLLPVTNKPKDVVISMPVDFTIEATSSVRTPIAESVIDA